MSNPFYNYSGAFIAGTLARAEAETAEFNSVAAGFALLSTQGVDSGVANAYVITTPGAPTVAYADGNNVSFKALNGNTTASTIAVNSIPAVPLLRTNGAALQTGDMVAAIWYTAVYNSSFGGFTLSSPTVVAVIPGTISGAVPTNKVGLIAAGGVATSAVPIDATFAIDQGISPTWTGVHRFTGQLAVGIGGVFFASQAAALITLNSQTATNAAQVQYQLGSTLKASIGVEGTAGATVSGSAVGDIFVNSVSSNAILFSINGAAAAVKIGSGGVLIGAPTGGTQGAGTLNATGLFINGAAVATGTVTSITGTANQVAASASTGAVTLSLPQNVIIPTPTAGVALTINGGPGTLVILNGSGLNAGVTFQRSGVSLGDIGSSDFTISGGSSADFGVTSRSGQLVLGTGSNARVTISTAGGVTVSAPSSGIAATINAVAGAQVLALNSASATNFSRMDFQLGAVTKAILGVAGAASDIIPGSVQNDLALRSTTNVLLSANNGTSAQVTLSSAGNVLVAAPSSGSTLTLARTGDGDSIVFSRTGVQSMQMGFGDAFVVGQAEIFSVGSTVPLGIGTAGSAALHLYTGGVLSTTISSAGNVTIAAPSSGVAFQVAGLANIDTALLIAPNTSNQSFGLEIRAGTSASDYALAIANAAASGMVKVFGDGGVVLGAPTGGDQGLGTLNCTGLYVNGGVVALGRIVVKQASTTNRATTTLSNDAVFTAAIPGAGTYQFRLDASAQNGAVTSTGVVYNINFSGTFTTGVFGGYGCFEGGTLGASGALISSTVLGSTSNVTTVSLASGGNADAGGVMGTLIATGAGTLALSWASTSTNSISIGNGSFVVERVV